MRLIVIDLVPTLLTWEGSGEPDFPEGAGEILADLFARYRLAAIADADRTGAELRQILDDRDMAGFFESVGTTAGFGPTVSARVLRRFLATLRIPIDHTAIVTGRPELAQELQRNRFAVVLTEGPDGFLGVLAALDAMEGGFNR